MPVKCKWAFQHAGIKSELENKLLQRKILGSLISFTILHLVRVILYNSYLLVHLENVQHSSVSFKKNIELSLSYFGQTKTKNGCKHHKTEIQVTKTK